MKIIFILSFLFISLTGYGLLYGETYYKSVDKNGNVSFSNVPVQSNFQNIENMEKPGRTSSEIQRAKDEADIAKYRLEEDNARSLRNTPNTRAHQGLNRSLQREKSVIEGNPYYPEHTYIIRR